MSDTYQITITTTSKETFTGKMKRSQPEMVNVTYGTASGSVTKDMFSPITMGALSQGALKPKRSESKWADPSSNRRNVQAFRCGLLQQQL